jgi:hypothetical protein
LLKLSWLVAVYGFTSTGKAPTFAKPKERIMLNTSKTVAAATGVLLLSLYLLPAQEAHAGRFFARGQNGAAGGAARAGQYGAGAAGFAFGPNRGGAFHAGQYAGPNGGNVQSTGASGYSRGVGAFRKSQWSGQAANGASGSGFTNNQYNAQTGQGVRNSSQQVQNAAGQKYGYSGTTDYTKGQGANSVIQTDNHGTYDVDYQKGQKPVITNTGNPTSTGTTTAASTSAPVSN